MREVARVLKPGGAFTFADLLVVDGNPLDDITILRDKTKISEIYKAGKQVPRLPL